MLLHLTLIFSCDCSWLHHLVLLEFKILFLIKCVSSATCSTMFLCHLKCYLNVFSWSSLQLVPSCISVLFMWCIDNNSGEWTEPWVENLVHRCPFCVPKCFFPEPTKIMGLIFKLNFFSDDKNCTIPFVLIPSFWNVFIFVTDSQLQRVYFAMLFAVLFPEHLPER